jgi:hypothetical protein
MTILNKDQVADIKDLLGTKTQKEIGDKFGVSRSVISDIACGRVHTDVQAASEASEEDKEMFKLNSRLAVVREERNALQRQLRAAAKNNGLMEAVVEEMEDRVVPMKALPKARKPYTKPDKLISEHLVLHLSDGHWDQCVTLDDSGGLETYNFPIAMARGERMIDTILKWTQETLAPSYTFPSLTVLSGGDHSSGEIHGACTRSYFRNMFKNCHAGGQFKALMLRDLAPYFPQINVICVPGNHGRRTQKKDYHGAHDNWDYLIASTARQYCRDIDNISFHIPNSFSANVDINGVGFQLFHGDDVRSNLGIPWYGLEKRRHRMMALDRVRKTIPIRYYCCGHFHRPGTSGEVDGEMVINGAWPATDSFAYNSLGGYTEPTQLLHGVHPEKGMTWRLPVQLRCEYEHEGPRRYRLVDMDDVSI